MQRRKFIMASVAFIPTITLGKNLYAETSRAKKGFVVKAKESRFGEKTLLFGNSPNDIKVSQKDTDGKLTIFEYTGNIKGGPALHIHPYQDEIFFIVKGEYLFQVGDEKHTLKDGDTIFLPRGVPHAFAQLTDTGKMFFLFQPSGKMEDFFKKISDPNFKPTPEEAAKVSLAYGMKVVGPPLQF
jgi:quercetin dioxygenase-like cupin family protein